MSIPYTDPCISRIRQGTYEEDYPGKGKGKDGKGKKGKSKSKGKCLVADVTLVDAGGIGEFP